MSDVMKDLVGTWTVSYNQYKWIYTFTEAGEVKWRDAWGGRTGSGTWVNFGATVAIAWRQSQTKEAWDVPINPDNQTGKIEADYGSGQFTATKDKTRFDAVLPEGQQDAFACWAACLSWYTRAQADVPTVSQQTIINGTKSDLLLDDGSITLDGIMTISVPNVFLNRSRITASKLESYIRAKPFPMIVAFSSGPIGGHANVIHSIDDNAGTVMVMEPWFPDPSKIASYNLDGGKFIDAKTKSVFKFTGKHISRPLTFYTSSPLNGQFIVGYNSKFSGKF